ncbi:MAG: cobalamin-binding protein [Pseudomonadota bacterium]|nr:cobalamin-binding protein [Pseudomonadota bacterium]
MVSLLPSATEIVCAVGGEKKLVGRSHECDFPSQVRNLPICTKARISSSAKSDKIDRSVKALLSDALSIYEVDVKLLEDIKPDLIVTQDQCEVCAVSKTDLEKTLSQMLSESTTIVTLTANDIAGVWNDIKRTAEAMGLVANGIDIVRGLIKRLDDIKRETNQFRQRPKVACIEWISPLMLAGNWVPELVSAAGGENILEITGTHSPYVNWETFLELDPDIIIAMPCGFNLPRTRVEMSSITTFPEWPRLSAVQSNAVYITDGNQYFNRPGPRIIESAEILAEILCPERFKFGHRGVSWEKL